MPTTYLVTGGAGFIGSHLADALIARGDRVIALDDLSTGSIQNLAALREKPEFEYYIDSMFNAPLLGELVDRADVVVHLAAAVGVRNIVESPVRTIELNVRGTELVLEVANKKKKLCAIASTSEVYGKSTQTPFHEDSDLVLGATTCGRWAYACSKAIDEFLALAYWKERRLPTVIFRFFNTVGPRQTGRYGMVLPNFVKQALAGRPITVYGDGEQSRVFGHVEDVVRGLLLVLDKPEAIGEVFNIGGSEEISINALAELVRDRTGSDSEIVRVPYEQAYTQGFEDIRRRIPDLTKITALTGYRPKYGIDGIVDDVIDHFRRNDSLY